MFDTVLDFKLTKYTDAELGRGNKQIFLKSDMKCQKIQY